MNILSPAQNLVIALTLLLVVTSCKEVGEQAEYAQNKVAERKIERPNVLLVYADDQGTLDAGSYGISDIKTPVLDQLAKDGIRFTQAYAHTVCCPSRAALLSGRYPQRSGVNSWTSCHPNDSIGRVMALKEHTIAEHLKRFGYTTAIIGKWHLGALMDHGPLDQGFDEFFGFRGGFIDYYSHRFLHSKWEHPQFHDLYRGKKEIFRDGEYFPDMQVDEANAFIEKNKETPFFLYLPFNLPHYPEQPDKEMEDAYQDLDWPRDSYARMITTFDTKLGKVLDKLDALGLRENTIVIYMSDNGHSTEDYYNWGESYGGNGGGGYTGKWRGAKGSFFEGGLRVPAIISYPKSLPVGAVRNQPLLNMDIFPTLCEMLEIPKPANPLDGKSAYNILFSEDAKSEHQVFHWMWQHMWAVRKDNWKLIYKGYDTTGKYSQHPEKKFEMPEFYLAKLDDSKPEEKNYAEEYPNIVAELRSLHDAWAIKVFEDSGDVDPNSIEVKVDSKTLGTKKL